MCWAPSGPAIQAMPPLIFARPWNASRTATLSLRISLPRSSQPDRTITGSDTSRSVHSVARILTRAVHDRVVAAFCSVGPHALNQERRCRLLADLAEAYLSIEAEQVRIRDAVAVAAQLTDEELQHASANTATL